MAIMAASKGDDLTTVKGVMMKEKEERSIYDNGIARACQLASAEHTMIVAALFFVIVSAFKTASASVGQAIFKSLFKDTSLCKRVTSK